MTRRPRLRVENEEGWYHIYCRTISRKGEYPLAEKEDAEKFIEILKFYSEAYFCDIASFCVMGNHYHIVVRFDKPKHINKKELIYRGKMLYPNNNAWVENWDKGHRSHVKDRLFNISEMMRNIHTVYTKWYNKKYERRGRFWAERFQSTILVSGDAVLECMQYVELNPIRAGIARKPESYKYGSARLREMRTDDWLYDIRDVVGLKNKEESYTEYKRGLYFRGEIRTKENQAEIPETITDEMELGVYKRQGFKQRVSMFTRGLVIGSKSKIEDWLTLLRNNGYYERRINPMVYEGVSYASLR